MGLAEGAITSEVTTIDPRGRQVFGTWPARLLEKPLRNAGILAALIIYPAVLVQVGLVQGPGLSPDSVGYAAAARSFAQSGAFLTISGESLTIWPPGFPAIFGFLLRLGFDLEATVVALNVICVMLTVYLSYQLAKEILASRPLGILCAAVVSMWASTSSLFRMLWTEPSFIVLSLLALVIVARALRRGRIAWWGIVTISIAVALATSIRFAGVTLIPVVALGAYFASDSRDRFRAWASGIATGGVASLGLAWVAIRNLSLGASALGDRSASGLSLITVLIQSVLTVGSFLVPQSWTVVATAIGAVLAVTMMHAVWRAFRQRDRALMLISAFAVIYWLMLWYSQLATRIDSISDRLASPIFAPMIILVIYGARELGPITGRRPARSLGDSRVREALTACGAAALMATWLISGGLGFTGALHDARVGIGYNSIASRNSPLALALVDLPPEAGVAASDAAKAYWTSGRSRIIQAPRAGHYWSPEETASDLRSFGGKVARGEVNYIAVFDDYTLLTPKTSPGAGIYMRLVATYEDGSLYEVSARP